MIYTNINRRSVDMLTLLMLKIVYKDMKSCMSHYHTSIRTKVKSAKQPGLLKVMFKHVFFH